jgi:hypothetical protein
MLTEIGSVLVEQMLGGGRYDRESLRSSADGGGTCGCRTISRNGRASPASDLSRSFGGVWPPDDFVRSRSCLRNCSLRMESRKLAADKFGTGERSNGNCVPLHWDHRQDTVLIETLSSRWRLRRPGHAERRSGACRAALRVRLTISSPRINTESHGCRWSE